DPDTGTAEWLRDQQLAERPRLAEGLSVEAGWELAVETVLGADLQAVLVDDFDALDLANFQQGDLRLLSAGADTVRVPGSLLEKVDSTVDLSAWLGQVIPVEDLDEALVRRAQLSAGQSLISRDGYWVGRHFLRVRRASEAQSGVLARGQELQSLGLERDEREATLATLEEQLLVLREQQSQQEEAREQLRRRVQDETRQQSELKAQLSALRWQALNDLVGQREAVIGNQEIGFEALVADQRSADASIERLRDGHHDLSERFNLVQGRFYSVGGDIARVEQSIQHGQQRLRQLQDDLREAERARQETESHLGHDTTLLATLGEELEMLEPEQEMTSAAAEESAIALEDAEAAMQGWQEKWDVFNQQSAEPQRQAQVQQSRIQQLEQSIERLAERQRRLAEERQLLAADPEDAAILELSEDLATRDMTLEELHAGEEQAVERVEQLREALQQASQAQQQAQGELQRLNGRLASLEALQQAA
ncbi:hypothetical protein ALP70_05064, partial [Pseudomonas savastanoi]